MDKTLPPPVLDPNQLNRIEAVHRGFLYQHLYAANCLLLAGAAGVDQISVERDEDIELAIGARRIYVQVKTRKGLLSFIDIKAALARFDAVRAEHAAGRRTSSAEFVIAANTAPDAALLARVSAPDWPADVKLHWPDMIDPADPALPHPAKDIPHAVQQCAALAATLPFALLTPEILVWKLAGAVALASAGAPPRQDHTFGQAELPELFEQLAIQLQDFPAPPLTYRTQEGEPPLTSTSQVRIVTGYSGAGKTAWVAQAAIHTTSPVAYFDVSDTPGQALASPLARDLAGRLFGGQDGGLGDILLPGSSETCCSNRSGAALTCKDSASTCVHLPRSATSSRWSSSRPTSFSMRWACGRRSTASSITLPHQTRPTRRIVSGHLTDSFSAR